MTLLSVSCLSTSWTGNLIRIYKVTDFAVPAVLLESNSVLCVNTQYSHLFGGCLKLYLEHLVTTATYYLQCYSELVTRNKVLKVPFYIN